jgi:hypothetical protein
VVHIPARDGKPARTAELTLFFQDITLQPPKHRAKEELTSVTVAAVWAIEEQPPAGTEPLEWLLLTSIVVDTLKQAVTVLDWYCRRWGIEIWHKTLKSGCAIETRQLESADRLRRCLAVFSVIAWRVMFSTMLARAVPEVACTAVVDEAEWQALYYHIHRTITLPRRPPRLRDAVGWIAQLGGFQGRKGDGEPGVTVIWKGFQHLADLTSMYCLFRRSLHNEHVGKD